MHDQSPPCLTHPLTSSCRRRWPEGCSGRQGHSAGEHPQCRSIGLYPCRTRQKQRTCHARRHRAARNAEWAHPTIPPGMQAGTPGSRRALCWAQPTHCLQVPSASPACFSHQAPATHSAALVQPNFPIAMPCLGGGVGVNAAPQGVAVSQPVSFKRRGSKLRSAGLRRIACPSRAPPVLLAAAGSILTVATHWPK